MYSLSDKKSGTRIEGDRHVEASLVVFFKSIGKFGMRIFSLFSLYIYN
jgi:hypothetical protein